MKTTNAVLVAVLMSMGAGSSSAGGKSTGGEKEHERRCLCLAKICRAIPVIEKIKKHCWKVECKDICIPRFRFPWSKDCQPRCGRVRRVRILDKKEYTVDKCVCEWEIETVPAPSCEPCDRCPAEELPPARPVIDPLPSVRP